MSLCAPCVPMNYNKHVTDIVWGSNKPEHILLLHGCTLTNGATTMSRANAQTIGTGGGIGPAGLKHDTHQKSEP